MESSCPEGPGEGVAGGGVGVRQLLSESSCDCESSCPEGPGEGVADGGVGGGGIGGGGRVGGGGVGGGGVGGGGVILPSASNSWALKK